MEIVIKQNGIATKVLGQQKVQENVAYRLLDFCIKVNKDNINLLYNNLTKELIKLTDEETALLNNIDCHIENSFIIELINRWFFVPTDFDDKKLSDQLCVVAKQLTLKKGIEFCNIFTTTACNARCFYCFEAGAKKRTMTAETAIAVADYIIENCIDNKISLQWFGGEPLCNQKAINIICDKLNDNNINFKSVIITNGYLIDEKLIDKIKNNWYTRYVQITLDGMQETYNKTKNYINPVENPFEKVMDGIRLLLDNKIFVSIRLNMDSYNEKELYELTEYLANHFAENKYFEVNNSLIYENVGFTPISRSDAQRNLLESKYFALCDYQEKLGISRNRLLTTSIRTNRCSADSLNSVQILPGGEFGNCEHYPDDYFYGSVFNKEPRQLWTDYAERLDICNGCANYPNCFMLKRCNTPQCSEFRKERVLKEITKSIFYTYEWFQNKKVSK